MGLAHDIVSNASNVLTSPHPYYPLDVEITGYLANEWGVLKLLLTFAAGCAAIFYATHVVVKRIQPTISNSELFTVMWFVLSMFIRKLLALRLVLI
jgi:cholestenol delta-isomerase